MVHHISQLILQKDRDNSVGPPRKKKEKKKDDVLSKSLIEVLYIGS